MTLPIARIALVVAQFNAEVTQRLKEGCLRTLSRHGIKAGQISLFNVPGSYEIPWTAGALARLKTKTGSPKFDVIICIGAILKGQTPQNDYIAAACAQSLQDVAVATGVPCIFGIITPATERQAKARTRGRLHRGVEAALAALDILKLKRRIYGTSQGS